MTNFEFYKDRIQELGTMNFARDKDGNLHNCWDVECEDCTFKNNGNCSVKAVDFLYAEHKEVPKLTKRERQFCEFMETGWIARDSDSDPFGQELYYYLNNPNKGDDYWDCEGDYISINKFPKLTQTSFNFIKWEDEEPWSIGDLLKLEVIEE